MVLGVRGLIGVDLYSIRPVDSMPRLAAANVPVLVIHGEADTYVPPINAHRLAASYGLRVETLSRGPHPEQLDCRGCLTSEPDAWGSFHAQRRASVEVTARPAAELAVGSRAPRGTPA